MATLTIRNVDQTIVDALKKRAAENHRSLEAEIRNLLDETVRSGARISREEFIRLADSIRAMTPKDRVQTDSVELLREDRNR